MFFECVCFHDISEINIEKHKALDATIESLVQSKSQIGVQTVIKFLGLLITARQCVVLCTVCEQMCTLLLPPGVNPTAANKYYIISYHIINYCLSGNSVIHLHYCTRTLLREQKAAPRLIMRRAKRSVREMRDSSTCFFSYTSA